MTSSVDFLADVDRRLYATSVMCRHTINLLNNTYGDSSSSSSQSSHDPAAICWKQVAYNRSIWISIEETPTGHPCMSPSKLNRVKCLKNMFCDSEMNTNKCLIPTKHKMTSKDHACFCQR